MSESQADMRKPEEWAKMEGIVIIDPDGWRNRGKSFDEPVSLLDFESMAEYSTIMPLKKKSDERRRSERSKSI